MRPPTFKPDYGVIPATRLGPRSPSPNRRRTVLRLAGLAVVAALGAWHGWPF